MSQIWMICYNYRKALNFFHTKQIQYWFLIFFFLNNIIRIIILKSVLCLLQVIIFFFKFSLYLDITPLCTRIKISCLMVSSV